MDKTFPFVEVPIELRKVLGDPLPGTRLYRKEGPDSEASYWHEALFDFFGHLVSPGGVSMYAPVSRAAVHRRIKDGKLTAFIFYVTTPKRNWFGTTKFQRELHYGYIPVIECKTWKKELEERAEKQGLLTREELEGEKPDWHGWFMEWNSNFAKKQIKRSQADKGKNK